MAQLQEPLGGAYLLPRESGVTDVWVPHVSGRWTTKTAAEQTEGRLLQMLGMESRGSAPPLHVHHDADETWYVLDGRLAFLLDGERVEAGPGDFVLGPKGVPHTYLVTSEQAELLVSFAPAGAEGPAGIGLDGFFREIGIPVVAGERQPEPVPPDPEDFACRAAQYAIEILGPPPTLD
jgi:mannose-6-phosphate isomerase-like protein (cupin superfamily)